MQRWHLGRSAQRAVDRVTAPIGAKQVRAALSTLTADSDVLLVHSGLSACGYFTSGLDDLLLAIKSLSNTLCLPTFTYCYPSAPGETGPLFDPASTPSQTGLLTERFRVHDGIIRSIHATHSIAADGDRAEHICAHHHQQAAPCGRESPFDRLVRLRASALLIGVNFHSYTLFHTAEDAAGSEYAYEPGIIDRLQVLGPSGRTETCLSKRQSRAPRRFKEAGELLISAGLARRTRLGRGSLTFVPDCAVVHDFLVERLKRTPDFLHQSCRESLQ